MKIFGFCRVKNEHDILAFCLNEASAWLDKVFVVDNGSEDGTWELIQQLSRTNPKVIPYKQIHSPHPNDLRAEVFNQYRSEASNNDWWVLLDADEFYIDSPREFLQKVPKSVHCIWAAHFQYYFINENEVPSDYCIHSSFDTLPRHYINNASELRFFRHRDKLKWDLKNGLPFHLGRIYPERIRMKHFQYRSIPQMEQRLATRKKAREMGFTDFEHITQESWKDFIEKQEHCVDERINPGYSQDEHTMPNHRDSLSVDLLKNALHRLGVWP